MDLDWKFLPSQLDGANWANWGPPDHASHEHQLSNYYGYMLHSPFLFLVCVTLQTVSTIHRMTSRAMSTETTTAVGTMQELSGQDDIVGPVHERTN